MEQKLQYIVDKIGELNIQITEKQAEQLSLIHIQMLADHFPEMDSLIDTTHASINHMNDFILINISNSPMNMIKAGISTGAFLMVLGAIPVSYTHLDVYKRQVKNAISRSLVCRVLKSYSVTSNMVLSGRKLTDVPVLLGRQVPTTSSGQHTFPLSYL